MTISKLESIQSSTAGFARRFLVKWVAVALFAAFPAQAMAVDSAFLRSLVIPGSGQAQNGHYTRAAIYGGAAIISGFGLIVAEVFYLESVDKFEAQRDSYLFYQETLDDGGVVSIDDLEDTYAQMVAEHDTADRRLAWRNGFAIALVTTYAVNLVDVLISKPYQPDNQERLSVEAAPGGVRITKMFRF
jgi:hypothetical protein